MEENCRNCFSSRTHKSLPERQLGTFYFRLGALIPQISSPSISHQHFPKCCAIKRTEHDASCRMTSQEISENQHCAVCTMYTVHYIFEKEKIGKMNGKSALDPWSRFSTRPFKKQTANEKWIWGLRGLPPFSADPSLIQEHRQWSKFCFYRI